MCIDLLGQRARLIFEIKTSSVYASEVDGLNGATTPPSVKTFFSDSTCVYAWQCFRLVVIASRWPLTHSVSTLLNRRAKSLIGQYWGCKQRAKDRYWPLNFKISFRSSFRHTENCIQDDVIETRMTRSESSVTYRKISITIAENNEKFTHIIGTKSGANPTTVTKVQTQIRNK